MSTQAKANIAVSNDCISGVFTPNVVVTINSVNRTSSIRISSLTITLNRNEETDTADFIVNRDGGFTPTAGQTVGIGLGDAENLIFGGQIATVQHTRLNAADSSDYVVSCVDWNRLFNRRLITEDFSGQSATAIATAIVEDYTSGFYTYAIESGLATVDEFICLGEPPLTALTRLAKFLGGGCYVDPRKIVHLWSSAGQSSYYAPSPPATLTNSLATLKSFTPEYDYSQVRTRVIVEGRSTQALTFVPTGISDLPIEYGWMFAPSSESDGNRRARIGSQIVQYVARTGFTGIYGPPAAVLTADANPGDTTINVASNVDLASLMDFGYIRDEATGQYIYCVVPYLGGIGSSTTLTNVPATGFGSILSTIPSGSTVYGVDALLGITQLDGTSGLIADVEKGEAVAVLVAVDDAAAQTALAAIEGGDGIHEYYVSDPDISYAGAENRADAELATFGSALVRASWVTTDMQAVPGAQQVINLSSPDVISTTITIDSVTIDFPVDNTAIASSPTSPCDSDRWPRRVCQGSTVKLATILDAIKG